MQLRPKVLVTAHTSSSWLSELEELADIDYWSGTESLLMPRSKLLSVVQNFDAVINYAEIMVDEEFIRAASKLRIIANVSIGFDNLNLPLLTANNKWATNAPGHFNYSVAEYVLAGILIVLRKLLEADSFVRQGKWQLFEPGRWDGLNLKDQTVGIIGLGSIGRELKKMVQNFGAKVVYHYPGDAREDGWVSFAELLRISDIISVHVPLNASTINLIDRKAICNMKEGAILINTSRGHIVDQEALIEGLESGKLAGAVLDVFSDEPIVPARLRTMKNVLLTPHIAGGTVRAREACVRCAGKNVAKALKGERPPNALNNIIF